MHEICVVNFGHVDASKVQQTAAAINYQLAHHVAPSWPQATPWHLRPVPNVEASDASAGAFGPASAVIYLLDSAQIEAVLTQHAQHTLDTAVGFVFTDLAEWTVTLSHEVVELVVDPAGTLFVPGSDPRKAPEPGPWLWHSHDVCDPVERTTYDIDQVRVSNFVTPDYFRQPVSNRHRLDPGPTDFLGIGQTPFGLLPGSNIGAVEPRDQSWVQILGSEYPAAAFDSGLFARHGSAGLRPRAGPQHDALLAQWCQRNGALGAQLRQSLWSFSRRARRRHRIENRARRRF